VKLIEKYEQLHWAAFNLFVRLFGILGLIVSVVFFGWAVYFLVAPNKAQNIVDVGFSLSLVYLVGSLISLAIAATVLRAPTYRPDMGDSAWSFRRRSPGDRAGSIHRSWWTGGAKRF
jgi:hypothetical protein